MTRITWQNVTAKSPTGSSESAALAQQLLAAGLKGIGGSLKSLGGIRDAKEADDLQLQAQKAAEAMMKGTYDSEQARRAILDQVKDPKRRDAILAALGNVPAEFQTATAEGTDAASAFAAQSGITSTLEKRQRDLNMEIGADRNVRLWKDMSETDFSRFNSPLEAVFAKFNIDADPETQTIHKDMANVAAVYNDLVKKFANDNSGVLPFPEELIAVAMMDSLGDQWAMGNFKPKDFDLATFDTDAIEKTLGAFVKPEQRNNLERQRQEYAGRQAVLDNYKGEFDKYRLRLSLAESRGDQNEIDRIKGNIDLLTRELGNGKGRDADARAANEAILQDAFQISGSSAAEQKAFEDSGLSIDEWFRRQSPEAMDRAQLGSDLGGVIDAYMKSSSVKSPFEQDGLPRLPNLDGDVDPVRDHDVLNAWNGTPDQTLSRTSEKFNHFPEGSSAEDQAHMIRSLNALGTGEAGPPETTMYGDDNTTDGSSWLAQQLNPDVTNTRMRTATDPEVSRLRDELADHRIPAEGLIGKPPQYMTADQIMQLIQRFSPQTGPR